MKKKLNPFFRLAYLAMRGFSLLAFISYSFFNPSLILAQDATTTELNQTKGMLRQSFERNKQLMEQNKAYEDKLMKLISQIEEQDKQIKSLTQKLALTMDTAQKTSVENETSAKKLQQAAGLKEKAEAQAKELQDLKAELAALTTEKSELATKLAAIEKEHKLTTEQAATATQKSEAMKQKLEEQTTLLKKLQAQEKAFIEAETRIKAAQDAQKIFEEKNKALAAEVQKLTAESSQAKAAVEEQKKASLAAVEENKKKNESVEAAQKALEERNKVLEAEVKKITEQYLQTQSEIEGHKKSAQSAQDIQRTLEEKNRILEAENSQVKQQYHEAQPVIEDQKRTIQAQSEKIAAMQGDLEGHAKELEVLLEKVRSAETASINENKAAKDEAAKAKKEVLDIRAQLEFKNDEIERLKKEEEKLRMTQESKETTAKNLQKIKTLETNMKKKDAEIAVLRKEVQGYIQNLDKLQNVSTQKGNRLSSELDTLKKQQEPLSEELKRKDEKIWLLEQGKKSRDEEIVTLQKKYDLATLNYDAELNELKNAKAKLTQFNQNISKNLELLQNEFSAYKKDVALSQKTRDQQIMDLKAQMDPLRNDLAKNASEVRIREKRIEDLKFAAESWEQKTRNLEDRIVQYENEIKQLKENQDKVLPELQEVNNALQAELKASKTFAVELQAQQESSQAKIAALEKTKNEQANELKEMYRALQTKKVASDSEAKKVIEKKEQEVLKLQNRLKALEGLHKKDRVTFLFNLGIVYTQQRLYKEAREVFEKALEIDPKDISSHYNLGILYEHQFDDRAKAINHYEAVMALSKDPAQIRQVETWIKLADGPGSEGPRDSRATSARKAFENLFLTSST